MTFELLINDYIYLEFGSGSPTTYRVISEVPITPPRRAHRKASHDSNAKFIPIYKDDTRVDIKVCQYGLSPRWFTDKKQAENYLCSLCSNISFDPVLSTCGHNYCSTCLLNLQKHSRSCAKWLFDRSCNKTTTATDTGMNERERKHFKSLKAACPRCCEPFLFREERLDHISCQVKKNAETISMNTLQRMQLKSIQNNIEEFATEHNVSPLRVSLSLSEEYAGSNIKIKVKFILEQLGLIS